MFRPEATNVIVVITDAGNATPRPQPDILAIQDVHVHAAYNGHRQIIYEGVLLVLLTSHSVSYIFVAIGTLT